MFLYIFHGARLILIGTFNTILYSHLDIVLETVGQVLYLIIETTGPTLKVFPLLFSAATPHVSPIMVFGWRQVRDNLPKNNQFIGRLIYN